ncbi:MAG: hypothetical protein GY756_09935 [bacterium]|nr:hypothetical protein [bacterium]
MILLENMDIEKISTNDIYSGKHWSERKKYKDIFLWLLKTKKINKIKNYPVKLKFVFQFQKKCLDASNCSYMAKMIEDGLCKLGILVDDDPKYVQSVELVSKKGKNNCVSLESF